MGTELETSARDRVALRVPRRTDGAALWRLTKASGVLDLNSPYAYLMWCDMFGDASIVAEEDGEVVGFVMGFRPPRRPEALFVWQVAVAASHRGRGLAGRMIDGILERTPDLTAVEATVTPSNEASAALFRGLARRHGCSCDERPHFEADDFPESGHESEILFRIGPIQR